MPPASSMPPAAHGAKGLMLPQTPDVLPGVAQAGHRGHIDLGTDLRRNLPLFLFFAAVWFPIGAESGAMALPDLAVPISLPAPKQLLQSCCFCQTL